MIKDVYDYAIESGLVAADTDGTIHKRYADGEMKVVRDIYKPNGYKIVWITIDGKQKILLAHRIVAKTYLPNPENKPQVNHIDGNKLNNRLNNLEWCTDSDNKKHAYKTGLMTPGNQYSKRIKQDLPRYKLKSTNFN